MKGPKWANVCMHQHYNGDWCRISAPQDKGFCWKHRNDSCQQCEDMLRAFPIRGRVDGIV